MASQTSVEGTSCSPGCSCSQLSWFLLPRSIFCQRWAGQLVLTVQSRRHACPWRLKLFRRGTTLLSIITPNPSIHHDAPLSMNVSLLSAPEKYDAAPNATRSCRATGPQQSGQMPPMTPDAVPCRAELSTCQTVEPLDWTTLMAKCVQSSQRMHTAGVILASIVILRSTVLTYLRDMLITSLL